MAKRGAIKAAIAELEAAANTAQKKAAVRAIAGVFGSGDEQDRPEPAERDTPGRKSARDATSFAGNAGKAAADMAAGSARGEVQPYSGQGRATAQSQR